MHHNDCQTTNHVSHELNYLSSQSDYPHRHSNPSCSHQFTQKNFSGYINAQHQLVSARADGFASEHTQYIVGRIQQLQVQDDVTPINQCSKYSKPIQTHNYSILPQPYHNRPPTIYLLIYFSTLSMQLQVTSYSHNKTKQTADEVVFCQLTTTYPTEHTYRCNYLK